MISAVDLVEKLALTYRQIDYLSREVLHDKPGSGARRKFDRPTVARISVAIALTDTCPRSSSPPNNSPLPAILRMVLDGPEPPESGWVVLDPEGLVLYTDDVRDLAVLADGGGLVARYEIPWT